MIRFLFGLGFGFGAHIWFHPGSKYKKNVNLLLTIIRQLPCYTFALLKKIAGNFKYIVAVLYRNSHDYHFYCIATKIFLIPPSLYTCIVFYGFTLFSFVLSCVHGFISHVILYYHSLYVYSCSIKT